MDIASGLALASSAMTTVKQLRDIDRAIDRAELKSKMADLYGDLAEVRIALSDAKEALAAAEGEVRRLAAWEDDRQRYTLTQIDNGILVYRYNGTDVAVPPHDICPTCFQNQKKSILQPKRTASYRSDHLFCHACGLDLIANGIAP